MFGNNKKFRNLALPMLILSTFLFYFYCGLYNDQINVLTPYYLAQGWTAAQVTAPFTIGAYIVIVLYPIIGYLMMKFGVNKILIPGMFIVGITTALQGFSGDNYTFYFIDMLIFRCISATMQVGALLLCSNWFIFGRGRALGIVTAGAPFATATLIAGLTYGIAAYGIAASYTVVGGAVIVIALLMLFAVKDTPEQNGLYPDGADTAPIRASEDDKMSLKEVLQNKLAWPLIVSHGLLGLMIVAVMAFYVTRLSMTGTDPSVYLLWLSIGAVLGIPASYLLGVVDDKVGTPKACVLLVIFGYIMPCVSLLFMKPNNIFLLVLTAIGIATMTGGMATLQPSTAAFVYGRRKSNAANRWIIALQGVIMAFALQFMALILDKTGTLDLAYIIMIGFSVVAAGLFLYMDKFPDYDRGFLDKRRAAPAEVKGGADA